MNQRMPLSIVFMFVRHVGWENGDLLVATNGDFLVATNNNLCTYNTTTDSSGATVRDAVVVNHGSYSATLRPWYKAGRDCGRYNNSRYGKTCITATYVAVGTGDIRMTLVQPFYDVNYTFLGSTSHHFSEVLFELLGLQEC